MPGDLTGGGFLPGGDWGGGVDPPPPHTHTHTQDLGGGVIPPLIFSDTEISNAS